MLKIDHYFLLILFIFLPILFNAMDWPTSNAMLEFKKLDYYPDLEQAVIQGNVYTTEHLLDKKGISLKNMSKNLLLTICNGKWGSRECSRWCGVEARQQRIAQLMIKKGAPSSIKDIREYLSIARSTNASERLIKYLEEVETTRLCKR